MLNPWDCLFNSPLSGMGMWDFFIYILTHGVRLHTGHILIEYLRSQRWVAGLWLASHNPSALSILMGSPRLPTGLPRTDSALQVLLSGKIPYPRRGRSLLPFFSNSNISPENSVLCKPELAGCSQTNKQGDYHYFRRAV